ncbi:hypothetical protein [Clostridium akagii]|uniref:hypothetical protein n=1 Tax=Clostridium akagii TaxID=91623 RepID=UPI0004798F92|nr:hypothetical protein [Clostridium akagii]
MVTVELINKLSEASKYLSNNDKTLEGNELESLSKQLQEVNGSKEKLEEIKKNIIIRCDVRWLGDIYIKEMGSPYKWWNFLGNVKALAEKL